MRRGRAGLTREGGEPRTPPRRLLTALALAATAVGALSAWAAVRMDEERVADQNEDQLASAAAAELELTLSEATQGVRGSQALVGRDGHIDPVRFDVFAGDVIRGSDIAGMGLAEIVDGPDRATFEARTGLAIKDREPGGLMPAARRDRYCPLVRITSRDSSSALGFDICADPARGPAATEAATTGVTQLSGPAIAPTNGRVALVVVHPLVKPAPSGGGRPDVSGFVTAALYVDDLVEGAADRMPRGSILRLTDGEQLLYGPSDPLDDAARVTVAVPHHTWTLQVDDGREASHLGSTLAALGGAALLILLIEVVRRTAQFELQAQDLSEGRRLEADRSRRLAQFAEILATAPGRADVVRAVLEQLPVALHGRLAGIAVPDEDGESLGVRFGPGAPPELAESASVAIDAERPLAEAFRTGAALHFPDGRAPLERYPARDPLLTEDTEATSYLPVLDPRGTTVAALVILWDHEIEFDAARVATLSTVANLVGQTLKRADLADETARIASTMQASLLSKSLQTSSAVVAARYQPAYEPMDVGGDWYDLLPLSHGRLGVVVGDVVGKGLTAAAVMGQLRSALDAAALDAPHPAAALEVLDRFASLTPGASFATAAYLVIDPAAEVATWCRAGHPPPLVVDPQGAARFLHTGRSWPLLARADGATRRSQSTAFPAGSLLVVYTDGLIERRGETIDDGFARLQAAVEARWTMPVERLSSELLDELRSGEQADDVAMLVLRTPIENEHMVVATFPARLDQLALARHRLRSWLERLPLAAETRDDIVLGVGEACANAVEHGYHDVGRGVITLEAGIHEDDVVVSVVDRGGWRPPDPAAAVRQRGRGLRIMRAVSHELRVEPSPFGTAVTMRVAMTRDRSPVSLRGPVLSPSP